MFKTTMFKTLMVTMAGLGFSALVSAQDVVEGQHYEVLESPVETHAEDGQIAVTEVFWFGCPHCYRLMSGTRRWQTTLA